eukprot:SAG31_NODE_775_length_12190_cov_5.764866_3_plen_3681_part_01
MAYLEACVCATLREALCVLLWACGFPAVTPSMSAAVQFVAASSVAAVLLLIEPIRSDWCDRNAWVLAECKCVIDVPRQKHEVARCIREAAAQAACGGLGIAAVRVCRSQRSGLFAEWMLNRVAVKHVEDSTADLGFAPYQRVAASLDLHVVNVFRYIVSFAGKHAFFSAVAGTCANMARCHEAGSNLQRFQTAEAAIAAGLGAVRGLGGQVPVIAVCEQRGVISAALIMASVAEVGAAMSIVVLPSEPQLESWTAVCNLRKLAETLGLQYFAPLGDQIHMNDSVEFALRSSMSGCPNIIDCTVLTGASPTGEASQEHRADTGDNDCSMSLLLKAIADVNISLIVGVSLRQDLHPTLHQRAVRIGLKYCVVSDGHSAGALARGFHVCCQSQPLPCVAIDGLDVAAEFQVANAVQGLGPNIPALILCFCDSFCDHKMTVFGSARFKAILSPMNLSEVVAYLKPAASVALSGDPGPVLIVVSRTQILGRLEKPLIDVGSAPVPQTLVIPPVFADMQVRVATVAQLLHEATLIHFHVAAPCDAMLLQQLAECVNGVITTSMELKGLFPESHDLWLWAGMGMSLPPPLLKFATHCDLLVVFGPFEHLDVIDSATCDQLIVAISDDHAWKNVQTAHWSECHATVFLPALLKETVKLQKNPCSSDIKLKLGAVHEELRTMEASEISNLESDFLCTGEVLSSMQAEFKSSTFVAADSHISVTAAEQLRVSVRTCLLPHDQICDAAVYFCLGAHAAQQRVGVALITVDEFLASGAGLLLAKADNIPIVTCVLDDASACGLDALAGRASSQWERTRSTYSVSGFAEALEIPFFTAIHPADLRKAIEKARRSSEQGPAVIHVIVDDSIPTYKATGISGVSRPSSRTLVCPPRAPDSHCMSWAKETLRSCRREGKYDIWTVLENAAHRFATKKAVLGGSVAFTYHQLYTRTVAFARFLISKGIVSGDRVGVLMCNSHVVLESHFAVAGGCKAVVLNLNQRLAAPELAYILTDSEPVWLIASTRYRNLVETALSQCEKPSVRGLTWIQQGEDVGSAKLLNVENTDYQAIVLTASKGPFAVAPSSSEDGAEMYYTSGTTGRPKGVILTHKNVILHALGCIIEHRLQQSDVWGHIAPMFHLVDAYAMFSITWVGGSHVMLDTFTPAAACTMIANSKVTATNMASTMITLIMAHPNVGSYDFTFLSLLSCGGAPLNRVTIEQALKIFGCEFFLSYGMTECCGKISMSLLTHEVRQLSQSQMLDYIVSSGRPFMLPHQGDGLQFELCIVKELNGEVLPVKQDKKDVGEVWIRGDTVFGGYWRNERATAESFGKHRGASWFKTGDLATCEQRQYLWITDRAKDMILVGSENVYSVEVERVLQDHADVVHACVYGVPDVAFGEAVKAVVQLSSEHKASQSTEARRKLQAHCSALLADFKRPTQFEFVQKMPLTGSGKIAKSAIRKRDRLLKQCVDSSDVNDHVLANDTYRVCWSKCPAVQEQLHDGIWIIIPDAKGVAKFLVERMRTAKATVQTVNLELLSRQVRGSSRKLAGVIYMAGLDECDTTLDMHKTISGTRTALAGALQCVQAICESHVRLWIVTRGAAVRAEFPAEYKNGVSAAQQAMWGFARVVMVEQANLQCHVVDLCPYEYDMDMDAKAIMQEISSEHAADKAESAWRSRVRFLSHLSHVPASDFAAMCCLDPNSSYLITGGTGGLGIHLAQLLIDRGAKNLILTARRDASTELMTMLRAKECLNDMRFTFLRADVADEQGVERLLDNIAKSYPPCRGIFHLAGLEGSDFIVSTSEQGRVPMKWRQFERVLLPKVHGSMHLHHFAEQMQLPLDHFVMFSSVYGLLGRSQLSHYAAANAFQDGLAYARQAHGCSALAVSWGTWSGAGMAHRYGESFERMWRNEGMRFVELGHGMATLAAMMCQCEPHVAILPADWSQYGIFIRQRQQVSQPLPRELVAQANVTAENSSAKVAELTPLAQELASLRANQRLAHLIESVLHVLKIIGIVVEEWDIEKNVIEYGVTSSSVVGLANELTEALGISVPATIVYEKVNLKGICEKLLEELHLDVNLNTDRESVVSSDMKGNDDAQELAIIGVGCRLPGHSNDPAAFWSALEKKSDCIVHPPVDRPCNNCPSGYLLADVVSRFDAEFFSISKSEASTMDPQQRLLLQTTHDALEDGNVCHESLQHRDVGVFVGISAVDYGALAMEQVQAEISRPTAYSGTSWSISIAANRLSYFYHFQGPSLSLDTACSSSLVAMNLCAKACKAHEITMAVVAGVNLQFRPVWSNAFMEAGMLSPTHKCKFGDDSADGYVRGEGCGAVLMKPRIDAHKDGNPVYGLVVNTSVNQDGHSNGLTAPNPAAQQQLLTEAYDEDLISLVTHIEAHGTGTRLGDPIELTAIHRALNFAAPDRDLILRTASVKSNIGHLECAAGIASIIKNALSMWHNRLAPSLHFQIPNRLIQWDKWKLRVVTECESVVADDSRGVLGCSGFGFGGTNAHVVMRQQAHAVVPPIESCSLRHFCVVPLSGSSFESVKASAARYLGRKVSDYGCTTVSAHNIASTAALCRHHSKRKKFRAAVVADAMEALEIRMNQVVKANDQKHCRLADGVILGCTTGHEVRLVLMFTGQGSVYSEMGKDLYLKSRAYRNAMDECDALLRREDDSRLQSGLAYILYGCPESEQETALQEPAFSQPALFAVEYSLAQVFLTEILPRNETGTISDLVAVMGHSLGEISAACIAHALTLDDACKLAAGRGKAMSQLPKGSGAMAACRASRQQVETVIKECAPEVCVAAVNGPTGVVISGSVVAVDKAICSLSAAKIRAKKLNISRGFHSEQVAPVLEELRKIAAGLQPQRPEIPIISGLTGQLLDDALDAEYWVNHARHAVEFMDGITTAISDLRCNMIIEIGPQPHLSPHAERIAKDMGVDVLVVRTLRSKADDMSQIMCAIGALFVGGATIDWPSLFMSGLGLEETPHDFEQPVCCRIPVTSLCGNRHWGLETVEVVKTYENTHISSRQHVKQSMDKIASQIMFTCDWVLQPHTALHAVHQKARKDLQRILIFGDDSTVSEDLCHCLQQVSADVRVACLTKFESVKSESHAAEEAHLRSLIAAELSATWDVIIFAIGLNADRTTSNLVQEQRHSCMALYVTLQIIELSRLRDMKILICTQGVHSYAGITSIDRPSDIDIDCVTHAPLWGLARCARMELSSNMTLKCMDISTEVSGADLVISVAAEINNGSWFDEDVLIRKNGRHVQRINHVSNLTNSIHSKTPKHGTVALTGGNGALGLLVAAWLAKRGAKRVLLLSRSGSVRPELSSLWLELTQISTAHVEHIICDAGDFDSVKRAVSSHTDLSGIFHCAGILDDRRIGNQNWDSFLRVFSPKVYGALNIHKVMRDCAVSPTCSFVMFSSVTSLMGNIGQANYGAANAFLDALAGCRRMMGLQGLSLQWGPWAEVGMASTLNHRMVWTPLANEDALRALDSALTMDHHLVAIARFERRELASVVHRNRWLRNFFAESQYALDWQDQCVPHVTVRKHPTYSSVQILSKMLQSLLKYTKSEAVLDEDTDLDTLGLDSIDSMQFVKDLSEIFAVNLSPNVMFAAQTVSDLRAHVIDEMGVSLGLSVGSSTRNSGSSQQLGLESSAASPAMDPERLMGSLKTTLLKYTKSEAVLDEDTDLDTLGLDSIDSMQFVKDLS